MCCSHKTIKILKESNISNHELSIILNNKSKEKLTDYLVYSISPINPDKLSKNKIIELIIKDKMCTDNNI